MKTIISKYLISIVFLLTSYSLAFSQNERTEFVDTDEFVAKIISPDFSVYFKSDDQKKDFKKLREYLSKKEDLFKELNIHLENYYDYTKIIQSIDYNLNNIEGIIKNKKATDLVEINPALLSLDYYLSGYYDKSDITAFKKITVSEIANKKNDLETIKKEYSKQNQFRTNLKKNIKNVSADIRECRNQIDDSSAVENRNQEFRKTISIYFTILIGILLVIFFLIVYLKSDNTLSKELLSGYGLQFITLFVLIIAVILFGILGILESSELSAILSGISGYILGKGIQDKKTIDLTQLSNSGNQISNPTNLNNVS
ncbi:hypothetical protein [Flavobacterium sp.]|uniref:hypothetical protein n=1 Tax=Flavobacterium sp. TaxID=239 RepID=UPI00391B25C4